MDYISTMEFHLARADRARAYNQTWAMWIEFRSLKDLSYSIDLLPFWLCVFNISTGACCGLHPLIIVHIVPLSYVGFQQPMW